MNNLSKIFTIVIVFSASIVLAGGESVIDTRTLTITIEGKSKPYSIDYLEDTIGFAEVTLDRDPHFGDSRRYRGFDFRKLIEHFQLGKYEELLLVCADGYQVLFSPASLSDIESQSMIAVQDLDLHDGKHWEPYLVRGKTISFNPFYMVWKGQEADQDPELEKLPWPYALSEIRTVRSNDIYAQAQPSVNVSQDISQGFRTFKYKCIKCHSVNGSGGKVGPALDIPGGLTHTLSKSDLSDLILNIVKYFPESKMPIYSETMNKKDIGKVIKYLKWINVANKK